METPQEKPAGVNRAIYDAGPSELLRRRRRVIGLDVGTSLDSANHGREILFEAYEVLAAE
jgi:hypothetical protein